MALKDKLKVDKIFTKYMKRVLKIETKDDSWIEELESLHARRGIRALKTNILLESSQKITLDSNIDNQAVRSRCVTIKIEALKLEIVLGEVEKKLRGYIGSKYSGYLSKKFGNMTERKNEIGYQLDSISRIQNRLKHVMKVADIIIEDCDSAGYTMHRIGEILNKKADERKER